jgi:predicted MFS family arabinose efflux permease
MARSGTLFYGWVIVAVTAIVVLATAGVRSAPGALLVPMVGEGSAAGSGWTTAGLSFVAAIGLLVFGLSGPLRRGLVTGLFGASTSAGQLLFFPLLAGLAVLAGWRLSVLLMAIVAALLVVPVLLWFREDPADLGLRPLGATGPATPARPADRHVMRRAVRSVDFWFLASTFLVCGATSNGLVGQHFISHAVDHGFTTVAASGALAVMGAFNFIGTIASGWLTDRYDPRKLLLIYYGFRGVSLLFLPLIHDSASIGMFAILFGLDYIATVPPTVMLVANTFGRHNVGVVYGWVFAAHQIGAAVAAWGAGLVREEAGDYAAAFYAAGAIAIVAGFAALMIGRMGRRTVGPGEGAGGDVSAAAA